GRERLVLPPGRAGEHEMRVAALVVAERTERADEPIDVLPRARDADEEEIAVRQFVPTADGVTDRRLRDRGETRLDAVRNDGHPVLRQLEPVEDLAAGEL